MVDSKVVKVENRPVMKHAGGRPTKYSPKVYKKLDRYLSECEKRGEFPTKELFAIEYGASIDAFIEWSQKFPKFRNAMKKLESYQKGALMSGALSGKLRETTAIFLLKANHGMMETSRTEITGKDGKDLQINVISFGNKQLINTDTLPVTPIIEGETVKDK